MRPIQFGPLLPFFPCSISFQPRSIPFDLACSCASQRFWAVGRPDGCSSDCLLDCKSSNLLTSSSPVLLGIRAPFAALEPPSPLCPLLFLFLFLFPFLSHSLCSRSPRFSLFSLSPLSLSLSLSLSRARARMHAPAFSRFGSLLFVARLAVAGARRI